MKTTLFSSKNGDIKTDLAFVNNYNATTNPTVNDDASDGYQAGSTWINQTNPDQVFTCVDATKGAAIWVSSGTNRKTTVTAMTTTAAITVVAILGGQITANQGAGATATYTMPTGTAFDAAVPGLVVGDSITFSITNISTVAAEDVTIQGATGMVAKGNLFIPSNDTTASISFGTFKIVKEAANTFSFYRIG